MITSIRNSGLGDALLLWFACFLALGTGAAIAFFRVEAAIDTQHDMTAHVLAVARADEALLRRRDDLEAQERQLDDSMKSLHLDADYPTVVAQLVREAGRLAALHHTRLLQIEASRVEPEQPHSSAATTIDERLESLPFDVALSGSYRDLLATVRDLGQSTIALHIEVAAIEQAHVADDTASQPPLTARLHIGLEHLRENASLLPTTNMLSLESHDARYR